LAKEGIHVSERVGMMPRGWKTAKRRSKGRKGPDGKLSSLRGSRVRNAIMGDVLSLSQEMMPSMDDDTHGSSSSEDDERVYANWKERRGGATLIGGSAARGPELERYLRTKVERMGHSEFAFDPKDMCIPVSIFNVLLPSSDRCSPKPLTS
jgi:hypothetical protein